jgi:hypothetical protein
MRPFKQLFEESPTNMLYYTSLNPIHTTLEQTLQHQYHLPKDPKESSSRSRSTQMKARMTTESSPVERTAPSTFGVMYLCTFVSGEAITEYLKHYFIVESFGWITIVSL